MLYRMVRDAHLRPPPRRRVETSSRAFNAGVRIGGQVADEEATSYAPVITVIAVALALVVALSIWGRGPPPMSVRAGEWSVAFSMAMSEMPELHDVERCSAMFVG